ncbi:hypothetical protein Sgou_17430 [Streptomyces gougerotii]|uniref:Beta-galactosidase n=1 Tax=Streptomyces gougerotii TaxID=53448 RepID=A0A8H9HI27_9ACTN|nr:hypothetical protein Sgou_17430 [Streptomyces gougerotii]GGU66848.1 hypothetical protein GCM10010227_20730 [Streptomyces gougerotii]
MTDTRTPDPGQGGRPRSRPWRRLTTALAACALAATGLAATPAGAAGQAAWEPGPAPMTTPWTDQVPVDDPLPEYPRPQLTRPDWAGLNGLWDFAVTDADAGVPDSFDEQIRVPFVAESALSGIQRKITPDDKLWYQREFTVPEDWDGRDVKLNFGGSDWQTTVWVNGEKAGEHKGGFDAFDFTVTDHLEAGANTVTVSVWDPTQHGGGAVGKQRQDDEHDIEPHPGGGIWYTAASGIWQTVWLEPVAPAHITRLDLTPELGDETLRATVHAEGAEGREVRVTVLDGGKEVGTATGAAGEELSVSVPDPRLWSPDDPFLYDVRAELPPAGDAPGDEVGSYAGMRSIGLKKIDGVQRPVLNGEFVFQTGTLDQGYWPDGLYTAPTDEALKYDLQAHKDLGFNMVRKHIKVEPQRWFHWADKLARRVRRPGAAHRGPRVVPGRRLQLRGPGRHGGAERPLHRAPRRHPPGPDAGRPLRLRLHRDHRRGERGQRPAHLRPAGRQGRPGPGPRRQPGADRRLPRPARRGHPAHRREPLPAGHHRGPHREVPPPRGRPRLDRPGHRGERRHPQGRRHLQGGPRPR